MRNIFCNSVRTVSVSRMAGIILTFYLWSVHSSGAEVTGLYDAAVPVATRDDERERQQAYNAALQEILLKLTGRQDTLQNPDIRRGLNTAQSYVESWTYRTAPEPMADGTEQLLLQVGFFPSEIQNLLNTARIPIWPQNRPETLLWIVVEEELGSSAVFGSTMENDPMVMELIQAAAQKRGLPLLLPLMDFIDQRALPVEQLASFDPAAIREASMRYGAESILALRIHRSISGETISTGQYLFRDQMFELDFVEDSAQPVVEKSIGLVAEQLASYYAVLLSGEEGTTEVLMTVEGVRSLRDYADLMQYAANMTTVEKVDLVSVNNGAVQLRLTTGGQLRQLIENIALDRKMNPVSEATRTDAQIAMHYLWQSRF